MTAQNFWWDLESLQSGAVDFELGDTVGARTCLHGRVFAQARTHACVRVKLAVPCTRMPAGAAVDFGLPFSMAFFVRRRCWLSTHPSTRLEAPGSRWAPLEGSLA